GTRPLERILLLSLFLCGALHLLCGLLDYLFRRFLGRGLLLGYLFGGFLGGRLLGRFLCGLLSRRLLGSFLCRSLLGSFLCRSLLRCRLLGGGFLDGRLRRGRLHNRDHCFFRDHFIVV